MFQKHQSTYLIQSNVDPLIKYSNIVSFCKYLLKNNIQKMMENTNKDEMCLKIAPNGPHDNLISDKYIALKQILKTYISDLKSQRLDWNERFQSTLDLPEETEVQRIEKYQILSDISNDFEYAATTCKKIFF